MSPAEVDVALREIIARVGAIAKSPISRPEEVILAKAIALLAAVVADQEQRLRVPPAG